MVDPLVSVIIPNYNHAQFLDERIQSVLNQTYQNFEVIILDDKSTDNSVAIINKYKDNPHISKVEINEYNSGSSFKQWHKGFELAKGDIVWIAESDDSCDSFFLETLIRGYVEHNAILAFSRSVKYSIDGNKELFLHQTNMKHDVVMPGRDFISSYMIDRNTVANASSAIFSREAAIKADRSYMSLRGEGDWLFWIELMENGKVYFCDKSLNLFRFHDYNTTQTLSYRGVSQIEHMSLFDYLVRRGLLSGLPAWRYKMACVAYYSEMEYDSFSTRKRVLHIWDKYRLVRLSLLIEKFKGKLFGFFH